jgi:hypothetical protein
MSEEPPPPGADEESQDDQVGEAEGEGAPHEPTPPHREQRLSNLVKLIGAILGTALTAATLYFLLFPRDGGCTEEESGALGAPTVDRGLRYREFLTLTNQTDPGADEATLSRQGTMISVPITATGYSGDELPLRWTTLTDDGRPVPEPELTDQLALAFVAEKCTAMGQGRLFAQWPKQPGSYMVEVALFEEDDEDVLATVRTPVFEVRRTEQPSAPAPRTS